MGAGHQRSGARRTGNQVVIAAHRDTHLKLTIDLDTMAYAYPEVPIPSVWTIRQKVDAPVTPDVETAARNALAPILGDPRLKTGASVAVGVGSRGINNLVPIVRTVIGELKAQGMEPFIVPAMGSHGGATAEGQEEVLRSYGISPDNVGAPIRATMEVAQVGALDDGYPVYFDCNAYSADAVIVVNRIKPHTDFAGEIESGPAKMCAIGLGKQKGASTIHRFGADGLRNIMPKVARRLIETCSIVGGIGIIENQFGQTAEIHGLTASEMGREKETRLLARAKELAPRLAFQSLDVLVIDEMGKNISGCGMDSHVIGRARMPSISESDWDGPDVRIIAVLDITGVSHGNAAGFGLADFTTRRLIERTDFYATFMNHRTSGEGGVHRGRMPIVLEDADSCVQAAIGGCGRGRYETVRLARIRNTEFVGTLEVSEALMEEVRSRDDLEILEQAHRPNFDEPLAVSH